MHGTTTEAFDVEPTVELPLETPRAEYVLLDWLGAGGMATVHRARQRTAWGAERIVALKRIGAEWAGDPAYVDLFMREAKIAASLAHPSVIQVYDFGRDDRGYFIAMEYVDGRSLNDLAMAAAMRRMPIPIGVVLAISRELCDALDHVHRQTDADGQPLDIIHRDVSFANVIITPSGHLKLIDFGIASARGAPSEPGRLVGKLGYMPPEAIRGGTLDARADVFAVGVVIWQLLCARSLFSGRDDAATIAAVLYRDIPAPSTLRRDCPGTLDAVVATALARDRERRPATAAELRDRLDAVIRQLGLCDATPGAVARWVASEAAHEPEPIDPESTMIELVATPHTPVYPLLGSRAPSHAMRLGAAATLVGCWFAISAGDRSPAPPPPVPARPVVTIVPLPSVEAPPAPPREIETAPPATPDVPRNEPRPRKQRQASRAAIQYAPRIQPLSAVSKQPWTIAPPPTLPELPTPASPLTVAPDRVRQLSGTIAPVNLRNDPDLANRRAAVVLCIDERGHVSSVRYVGRIPLWVQHAIDPSLRAFTFSPYRTGRESIPVCFTRSVVIVPG